MRRSFAQIKTSLRDWFVVRGNIKEYLVMPILAAQPTTFPEALFDTSLDEFTGRRWSVLQTRSRQEKRTALSLHDNGTPYFLPLIPKRLLIRGKTMQSYLPLFGGYVFLLGERQDELF